MLSANNKDTRTTFYCIIVDFGHISHVFLVLLLMTANKYRFTGFYPVNL